MHLRIYQENPAVRAVVHAHPPAATAFAAAGLPLDRPVLQEAVVQLGTVPVAPFALPGSQAVADSVAPYCQAYRALLLEYHGAVTWGTSMEQAHYRLECLEQLATVTLHLRTLGIHRTMPRLGHPVTPLPFSSLRRGFPLSARLLGAIPHSLYQTFPEKTTKIPKFL